MVLDSWFWLSLCTMLESKTIAVHLSKDREARTMKYLHHRGLATAIWWYNSLFGGFGGRRPSQRLGLVSTSRRLDHRVGELHGTQ